MKIRHTFLWIIGILLIVNTGVGGYVCHQEMKKNGGVENLFWMVDHFLSVFRIVREEYVDGEKMDNKGLFEHAINGIFEELEDFHSSFMLREEFVEYSHNVDGELIGIGVIFGRNEERKTFEIRKIFSDSPAEQAGICVGDEIKAIDDKEITGEETPEDIAKWMTGKINTAMKLQIYRPSEEKNLEFTLLRNVIALETVMNVHFWEESKIGYLRIDQFTMSTDTELEEALKELSEKGMEGLVIDLRDNPGGFLHICQSVCSFFLPEGELIVTAKLRSYQGMKNRESEHYEQFYSLGGYKIRSTVKVVLLVNENSASSSELMSSCLQDHHRARLVGVKTYGKGSIQQEYALGNGAGLSMTIGRYYPPNPNRRTVDKYGVKPDVQVKISEKEWERVQDNLIAGIVNEEEDAQLKKALELLQEKTAE